MSCHICFERYDLKNHKPITVMLCGHTFCSMCLIELRKGHEYMCPLCKSEIVNDKPNYSIIELLEENQMNQKDNNSFQHISEWMSQLCLANCRAPKLLIQGDNHFKESQYEDAIKTYDLAIQIDPFYSEAFYKKGRCLMSIMKYNDSIDCFNTVIRLNATHLGALNYKGFCLKFLSRERESKRCFHNALLLNQHPNDSDFLCNKGLSFEGLDMHYAAITKYDKAINIDPNHIDSFFNKGYSLFNLKEYKEAINCYEKCLEINSKNANAYFNKGIAFRELKKLKEAISCFDRCLEINANYSAVFFDNEFALKKNETILRIT